MTMLSVNTLLAAFFFTSAGISGLVRHFLLEPRMSKYPRAPKTLLMVFFFFSTMLIFFGMRAFAAWSMNETAIPPAAAPSTVVLSFSIAVYKLSMLYNTLSQRYPVEVWLRLERISELARCSRRRGAMR